MQVSKGPVPGKCKMNNRIPDLQGWHIEKIVESAQKNYPEFSICLDGTPTFAECECIILRMVDKSFNIHEYVIHLELYAHALSGENIAHHIEVAIAKIKLDVKNWRATMLDRATTNKKACRLMSTKHNVTPLEVWCISHGTAACGKKGDYPEGKALLRGFSSMTKHSLCRARVLFEYLFKESARRLAGVRFCIESEFCEQIDRLGIDNLVEEYVKPCAKEGWSKKSANKVLKLTKTAQEVCVASCQIAAIVDVGMPVTSGTYTNESKQPNVFVIDENLVEMQDMFGRGIDFFDGFERLDKRATEATARMEEEMASVNYCSYCFICYQLTLIDMHSYLSRHQCRL